MGGKVLTENQVEKIIRYSDGNPNLSQADVGALCGCSGSAVCVVNKVNACIRNDDYSKITDVFIARQSNVIKAVAKLHNMTLEDFQRKANPAPEYETIPIEEEEPQSEELFYLKVMQGVACLPDILNAINNLSDKITTLSQRQFEPLNRIDYTLQDCTELQETIKKKVDRISRAVSNFENPADDKPKSVMQSIEEGFDDVAMKLDTVRTKLDKAIK